MQNYKKCFKNQIVKKQKGQRLKTHAFFLEYKRL